MLKTYQKIVLGIGGIGIVTSTLAGEINNTEIDWAKKLCEKDLKTQILWIGEIAENPLLSPTATLYKDEKGNRFIRYIFYKGDITHDVFDSATDGLIGLVDQNGKTDKDGVDAILETNFADLSPESYMDRKISKKEAPKLHEEMYNRIIDICSKLGKTSKSKNILTDEGFSIEIK